MADNKTQFDDERKGRGDTERWKRYTLSKVGMVIKLVRA
jgi:hypothetical protein